ncbi:hypothetical protein EYC80_009161 [Monilinia laxa]|uniref:Uncharacterized protein n=1 Tax=Monilinia laxa TaxID=61186 RepID=A0A5N6K2M3_MONLA|nr:hypothetical protein EYC80_009161 [Monilinia laxa]
MGNAQSVQGPRRSKKLSKPKTKPTGLPSSTSNSPNISRRNSVTGKGIISAAASVLPHGKLLSVLETESQEHTPEPIPSKKKRLSIFRSRSSKKDTENHEPDVNIDTVPSGSPQMTTGRFTRSNSVNSVAPVKIPEEKSWGVLGSKPSFHRSRKSLPHVSFASNSNNNRLSHVSEDHSPRPDSINIATGLTGQKAGEMDWQLSDPFCQRTQSDPAIYAPIRRKSLLQHGVATRPSVMSNSQSFQNQIPISYHNFGQWSVPPLTLSTNVDVETPGARTSTPCDLGHIGSFQLGSLRITNGSASPTPSAEERRASLPANDQHIAAFQASSKVQGIAHRSHTISVHTEAMKRPWAPTSFLQPPTENSFHDALTIKIPDIKSTPNSSLSPTNAHSLVLPPQLSPFSFVASPVGSPFLDAVSTSSAIDDELSEAEISTPALEPSSGNDNRSFDSAYGQSPATPEQQIVGRAQSPQDMISNPLVMTDSGYNPSTSRRNSTAVVLPTKDPLPRSIPQKYSDVLSNDQLTHHSDDPAIHAIPMFNPESQKKDDKTEQLLFARLPISNSTATAYVSTTDSQREIQRQCPQSSYPGASAFTAQSRSHSEKYLPAAASFQYSTKLDEIMGYKSMRKISSKETITTITSLDPAEMESTYTKQNSAIPPIPTSIPEENYHTGWKPPNVRRHSYAPSASSAPMKRYTLQPYHAPTSLNIHPQEDQTDFENHLTSLDTIKSSLGGSPYDLAVTAMERTPPRATPRAAAATRTESMTAHLQSPHAKSIQSQSEEPPRSRPDINCRQESYNKLVGGSPFDNDSTGPNSRTTSSGSLFTLRDLPSQRRTADEDAKRLSIARTSRVNSPPPASFHSQRNPVPVSLPGQFSVTKLRSSPVERSFLQPLSPETQTQSKEISSPPTTRSHTSNVIREVTSQESVTSGQEIWFDSAEQRDVPSQLQDGNAERPSNARSQSARPATKCYRAIPLHHFSFDVQNNSGKSSRATSVYSEKEWEIHAGTYDHTYGSTTNLHEFSIDNSVIEYDSPYSEEPEQVPKMGNSTQDMLVLDRYAGGLGYGFEPGYGLGGSAGTRNSGMMSKGGRKGVDVSKKWGLDFSDVPIMIQRVPVKADRFAQIRHRLYAKGLVYEHIFSSFFFNIRLDQERQRKIQTERRYSVTIDSVAIVYTAKFFFLAKRYVWMMDGYPGFSSPPPSLLLWGVSLLSMISVALVCFILY